MLSYCLLDQRPSDRSTSPILLRTLFCRFIRCTLLPRPQSLRGLRKETTSLFTSANRSIKTSPDIEGDGPEVAREGRDLLEPTPAPKAKAAYEH